MTMTAVMPTDVLAAQRIVNLWRDGISYHVAPVDLERLKVIAAGVLAQHREGAR